MTRGTAAARLVQLLSINLVGDALDVLDDFEVRRLLLSAMHRCRGIATDEASAVALQPRRAP